MPSSFPLVPRYERKGIGKNGSTARYQIFYRVDGEPVYVIRVLARAATMRRS